MLLWERYKEGNSCNPVLALHKHVVGIFAKSSISYMRILERGQIWKTHALYDATEKWLHGER